MKGQVMEALREFLRNLDLILEDMGGLGREIIVIYVL